MIKKLVEKIKTFILNGSKYKEVDGVRYYIIGSHKAKVVYDEHLGFYVGDFVEMRAMTSFYAYYEQDIHSAGNEALRNYLCYCEKNDLNPMKE